jgi:hypothetical protein
LEIGGTYTTGSRDGDNKLEAQAWSGDVTAIHQMNAINRLKLQAEAWWLDIEENPSNDDPWGLYALIDYRVVTTFNGLAKAGETSPAKSKNKPNIFNIFIILFLLSNIY